MGQKILVASIRDLLRFGLRTAFKDECHSDDIYEATTHEELRRLLMTRSFDLVIIQESLVPDMRCLAKVNFVLITTTPSLETFQQAYQHGGRGYVSENVNADLLRSILYLEKGTFFLDPALFPWMMEHMLHKQEIREELDSLSPRERQIFDMLQDGEDRRVIARKLSISESTLKTHIKNINRKRESKKEGKILHLEAKSG